MSNKNTRPRVVVVGGSFSGLCAVRHLKNRADVTRKLQYNVLYTIFIFDIS